MDTVYGVGYPISQTVTGLPNGRYRLTAVAGPADGVVIKGNGQTSAAGAEGEAAVEFYVTDGTATIGAEGVNGAWFNVDNFKLYKMYEVCTAVSTFNFTAQSDFSPSSTTPILRTDGTKTGKTLADYSKKKIVTKL